MTIRAKLSFMAALVAAGLFAGLAVQYRTDRTVSGLRELRLRGERVLARHHAASAAAAALLHADAPLAELYGRWSRAVDAFDAESEAFLSDGAFRYLPRAVRASLGPADVGRRSVISELRNADAALRYLADYGGLGEARKRGLGPMLRSLESEAELASIVLPKLRTAADLLEDAERKSSVFLSGELEGLIAALEREAAAKTRFYTLLSYGSIGGLAAILVFAMALFGKGLGARIGILEQAFRKVRDRDLTVQFEDSGRDELGRLSDNIQAVVSELRGFFAEILGAVAKVDELKEALAAGTTESAASLGQISGNIASLNLLLEDLSGRMTAVADSVGRITGQTADLSRELDSQMDAIGRSVQAARRMDGSIKTVADLVAERKAAAEGFVVQVRSGQETMEGLRQDMTAILAELSRVHEIIGMIDEISDRTNILSINAAIESAHAGAQGAGFAVVAGEIGRLAESTAENSKAIGQALESIVEKISRAGEATGRQYEGMRAIGSESELLAASLDEIGRRARELEAGGAEVYRAASDVESSAEAIRDRAGAVRSEAEAIGSSVEIGAEASRRAAQGIAEIGRGADEIALSLSEISASSNESKERVEKLGGVVAVYTI